LDDLARHQWVATQILPHEGEVRGWLRRHVRTMSGADVDDLVQEAYSRLWLVDFARIGNGRSYLYTVIRNLVVEQARRARIVPMERMGEIESLRIPSEEPGPERSVNARQELERLARIVDALPEQCRRAFQLQKFGGLSQREIAQEMNISEKTVEKHLAMALVRVLDALRVESGSAGFGQQSGASGHDAEQTRD
jgi:RNA polymerase sigma factor (sigma-70 family)